MREMGMVNELEVLKRLKHYFSESSWAKNQKDTGLW